MPDFRVARKRQGRLKEAWKAIFSNLMANLQREIVMRPY